MANVLSRFVAILQLVAIGGAVALSGIPAQAESSYDPSIRCYNIAVANLQPLRDAASTAGLNLEDVSSRERQSPEIVLWETKESADPGSHINELSEYVRQGGCLIVTLDQSPGTGAFQMKSMLPTTAWRTLLQTGSRGGASSAISSSEWDPAMFPQPPAEPLKLPFYFPLRPADVVEGGMQRYERFEHPELFGFQELVKSGTPSFTRPLLDRDWKVRVRSSDVGQSGLLITGRYGAGRVAVFASSARFASAQVWGPLLKWLKTDRPAQPIETVSSSNAVTFSSKVDAEHRSMIVELSNNSGQAQRVEVIGRVLTWEHAMIGDVSQTLQIAANAKVSVKLPLPAPGPDQRESLGFRDAFIVRLGVIGNQGSTLLQEKEESVDLRPVGQVSISLDNLRQRHNPFDDVAGENGEASSMGSRMGEPVTAYAYAPGEDVNVTAMLSNGITNIAPAAKVTDETQPNNPSVVALNDQVQPADRVPMDKIAAYGVWEGKAQTDNSLLFTFSHKVHVSELVITGEPAHVRDTSHDPGEVVVEADDRQLVDVKDFESQLNAQNCAAHLKFSSVDASTIRVRMPWILTRTDGKKRTAPWIGEIEIRGYQGEAPHPLHGRLTVTLSDAGRKSGRVLVEQNVELNPGEQLPVTLKIPADQISTDASVVRFFRIEGKLVSSDGQSSTSSSTFMVVQPVNPLRPIEDVHPTDAAGLGFCVTHGFRNGAPYGTGTRQADSAWGTPDDLVYAYEHGLKQTGKAAHHTARQFFVTENDFKHYCAPWSIFPNGDIYFDVAAPYFVELEKKQSKWNDSKFAQLGFGDRWDAGPAASLLYSWPELVAFDEFLRSQQQSGLTGKTREQVVRDIEAHYSSRFSAWHMARYAQCVKAMSQAFADAGKKLIYSGQGTPLVPDQYQEQIASTLQGMSDDTTWGMSDEDVPRTTGRQMATLAFNPVWNFNELFVWGYDSAVLNNPHWHAAVGTTESSRRHYADPGWRGIVDPHGRYHLSNTFGFGMNANVSFCMTLNDWQEMWRMQERLSLITPDGPLGAGVIVANASWNDPQKATFSGGGMGGSPADSIIGGIAQAFGTFCDLRIPIAFTSNIMSMENWPKNTPLILLDMSDVSKSEIKVLQSLHHRGVRLIGFSGGHRLQPEIAELFGATPNCTPAGAKAIGEVSNQPVLATETTLLLNMSATTSTAEELRPAADAMRNVLSCGLEFPAGTAGYGFTRGKQNFVVAEDWNEQAREVAIRLRATPGAASASAVNVNDHLPVDVTRDGQDWVIRYTTRPGDGTLLCVEEK